MVRAREEVGAVVAKEAEVVAVTAEAVAVAPAAPVAKAGLHQAAVVKVVVVKVDPAKEVPGAAAWMPRPV